MSENPSPSQSEMYASTEHGKVIINERTSENFARHGMWQFLVERMKPDFGLCDKLRTCGVLTRLEHNDIKNWRTSAERNSRLLEIITEKQKYQELFNALRDTQQGHLVNYITGNGVYSAEYCLIWPLTEKEINIIENNREELLEIMETDFGLVDQLLAKKFINNRQKKFLDIKKDEVNETLLDILLSSSIQDYWTMIECLRNANQSHVADLLLEGGVLLPVRNTLEADGANVPGVEMKIVDKIQELLGGISLEDASRVLEVSRLRVLAAIKGQSIILYFWCQNVEELQNLRDLLHSDELRKIIERFFNHLGTGVSNIRVTTTQSRKDLALLEAALGRKYTGQDILKLCEQFPVVKAGKQQVEEEMEVEEEKNEEVQTLPMEVLQQEIQHVEKKQEIEPMEAEESQKGDPRKTAEQPAVCIRQTDVEIKDDILRNNSEYLVDNMCTKGLVDELHAEGCLIDSETRYIKTLVHDRDKKDEILKVIRNGSLDIYNKFADVLHRMDQHIIAEVLERGGIVVKASVTIDQEHNESETIKEELVNSINQLLSKAGPVKPQLLQFFCLLKRNDLDILSAKHEKDIILWIWCRSKAALRKLNKVNELDVDFDKTDESDTVLENFIKILTGLFLLLLDNKEIPEIINVDLEDTDRRFVCHTPCSKHLRDLQIASQNVCGIAELDEKFYILSQNPSKINEFESLDSTDSETWILSSVKDPVEIVSSNKHHCLYISDTGSSSIWKATAHDRKVTQWLKNISNSFTMSLTKDEHVLLLRRDQPATIEVYDSNAKQKICVALPSNIVRPIHAVESLTGSFFISFRGENEGQSGICEMTKKGDTVTVFDSSITGVEDIAEDINQVLSSFIANEYPSCYPEYLALDKHRNLYATDPHNSRLMVLDERLNLETILTEDLINRPINMQFVKFQKQLIVLHGADQKIISVVDIQ